MRANQKAMRWVYVYDRVEGVFDSLVDLHRWMRMQGCPDRILKRMHESIDMKGYWIGSEDALACVRRPFAIARTEWTEEAREALKIACNQKSESDV